MHFVCVCQRGIIMRGEAVGLKGTVYNCIQSVHICWGANADLPAVCRCVSNVKEYKQQAQMNWCHDFPALFLSDYTGCLSGIT